MHTVILGCGRVGATLALMLEDAGHSVSVIDQDREAFRRLGKRFRGKTILGIGIDEDVLRKAGIERARAFAATTSGDNSNIMSAQIAKVKFKVPRVIARIYDPLRAEAYKELGIDTISPTLLGAGLCLDFFLERPFRTVAEYQALPEILAHS
ncbi:MAG: TrkA family potassium uptake protein [Bacillati bacterium ANGP1]|uniref:TrkA family potassium uptake protein n=1 Tax=Candidatus Segetimicrobium genomatis TaxID=2569760 RepID=A0A537JV33_9BACT|nr:MAG: TrkA family potassium uptake protein [Terrabacteria group bacterium ANGP1]